MNRSASRRRPSKHHPCSWRYSVAGAAALLMLGPSQVLAQKQIVTKTNPASLTPALIDQIASLEADKDARTPAQQKMDSQLIYAAKMYQGQPITAAVPTLDVDVPVNADGTVLVDIDGAVSNPELQEISQLGGQVIVSVPELGAIRAIMPLMQIETLAADPSVRFIRPAAIAELRGHGPIPPGGVPVSPSASSTSKAARVRAMLPGLLSQVRAHHAAPAGQMLPQATLPSLSAFSSLAGMIQTNRMLLGDLASISAASSGAQPINGGTLYGSGDGSSNNAISSSNIEEGYTTHRANLAFSTYGVTGSGIKIGVLSDSAGSLDGKLATATSNGYVSSVTVTQDVSGTDEGLAMLEIVHALAPGATLYFATGDNGEASYAQNIQTLRNDGCDIILDDLGYFDESPFQDGVVAQAVRSVTNAGALYFSAAGNAGDLDSGIPAVWEGDYNPSTVTIGTTTFAAHSFGTSVYNVATTSGSLIVNLFWSDPLGGSTNDYDLYVVNSSNALVRSSTNTQNGSQDPYEQTTVGNGNKIVIVKKAAAVSRFLHLSLGADDGFSHFQFGTNGQIAGHPAVNTVGMYGVAATDSQNAYPNAFNSSDPFETFTSDGPRHVFYNADGSVITPGNVSSTGGTLLSKPDITASDGVNTALNGFKPFYGTSAAAPHAGAIAALVKSYNPSLTQSQIRSIFTGPAAIDIGAAGYDRDSGYGIVDAFNAVTYGNTVSGTVTASNGTPISGVTFTVTGQAATASTDTTGAYTLSPVPVGTLTVTPFKAGFNFLPASQSVTVGMTQPNGTASFVLSQPGIRTSVSSVTLSGNTLSVTVTLANGGGNVTGATLTRASLGASAAPSSPTIPSIVGAISTGNTASITLQYPRSAGASGTTVPLRISGTTAGNGSFSGSFQVVLP
jgi:hypothetical protein